MNNYCCVVNCQNNETFGNIRFFEVLRKDPIQTEKWIKAINRTNPDGTPWIPGKDAKICGNHFICGDPRDPNYVPSIFPPKSLIRHSIPYSIQQVPSHSNNLGIESDTTEEDFSDEILEKDKSDYLPSIFSIKPINYCTFGNCGYSTDEKKDLKRHVNRYHRKLIGLSSELITHYNNIGIECGTIEEDFNSEILDKNKSEEKDESDCVQSIFPIKPLIQFVDPVISHSTGPKVKSNTIKEDFSEKILDNESDVNEKENYESTAKQPKIITVKPLIQHTDQKLITKHDYETIEQIFLIDKYKYVNVIKKEKESTLVENDPMNCRSTIIKCGKDFLYSEHEVNHEKGEIEQAYDGKNIFHCSICDVYLSTKGILKTHFVSVHDGKKPFKCSKCDSSFLYKYGLNVHIESVHEGKKPFKCSICDNSFSKASSLKRHILTVHEGKRQFNCHICDASFTKKPQLKAHLTSKHEGHKHYKCSNCKASFFSDSKLSLHILLVHKEKKSCICSFCGHIFSRTGHLKEHIESVHEGKKPFKCPTCDYSFYRNTALKNHISAVHEGKKPYLCFICAANFASVGILKRHILYVHEKKKPHKCSNCDISFAQDGDLKKHYLTQKCTLAKKTHIASVHKGKNSLQ